jgi:hypothetical protein
LSNMINLKTWRYQDPERETFEKESSQ